MASTRLLSLSLLVGLWTVPALAQGTAEQRNACEGDAMRLCSEFVPDVDKITACMQKKQRQLSPACRAQVASERRKPASDQ